MMKSTQSKLVVLAATLTLATASLTPARADAVTDWNAHWEEAVFATQQPVPAQGRYGATLHAAIFDAVNGISRRFTPYYVTDKAPPGADPEAAAVQAAYTVLKTLYPTREAALGASLDQSLGQLSPRPNASESIARGRAWGEAVAYEILAWRSNDGWSSSPAPYYGSLDPGKWRSIGFPGNPDGSLPAVYPQLATLEPFSMTSPSQFRPGPPYAPTLLEALTSAEYAEDVNEVQEIGRIDSTVRTAEQTHLARLWQAMGPIDLNRAARSVVPDDLGLVESARLFALVNIVACDALIASMDSKFVYHLWRPAHAIQRANVDNNPATDPEPSWTALILAPRFPEYVSNHASITGGFMYALAQLLGDEHAFTLSSPNYPAAVASYDRLSEAAEQVKEARIWAGIHFRNSCHAGQVMGQAVAQHALRTLMLPIAGADQREPVLPGGAHHLQAPAGNRVAFVAYASGVQIYACRNLSTPDSPNYQWVFSRPEADLFANANLTGQIGTHYRGPTWESNSGSQVKATFMAGETVDPTAIPWLLLRASSSAGPGIFDGITFIQRVQTVGGLSPSIPCTAEDEGKEIGVPYTAVYYFYRSAE